MNSYRPIRDYAVIGDCHGSALVSREGSIDWCCLRRMDSDPAFCRILDSEKGGFFSLSADAPRDISRTYIDRTAILRTTYECAGGTVVVTDFMPVGRAPGSGVHDYVNLSAPFWLVRRVECTAGSVTVHAHYRPTIDFARRPARLEKAENGIVAGQGPFLHAAAPFDIEGDVARASIELAAGERRDFVVMPEPDSSATSERIDRLLAITHAFWNEWLDYSRYGGPYRAAIERSALTLKLLTYAPTGAIAAAATTSLPEEIGGSRNWDYRFCWPRDVSFTLYALASLGYSGEAKRFADFLYRSCQATHPRVQVLYGIGREADVGEVELEHLEGYRGSRPVRVGNGAYDQTQLDVYGEVLDWAHTYRTLGGSFSRDARGFLKSMARFVAERWEQPDQGIWEMRGEPRHHVYSKIMSWVAIDRAIRMFGDSNGLKQTRDRIVRTVLEQGIRNGRLVGSLGDDGLDAALLRAPLEGFPAGDDVLKATIDAIDRDLRSGDYVYRYRQSAHAGHGDGDDGLSGEEGAFLVCSFWLVDALLVTGRVAEATALFERLLRCANDVGLYAEEVDPTTHEFLGNVPQALTHLGVIQCAVNLELCKQDGHEALRGTNADRVRHGVEAAAGLRGLWAAFKKTGRLGRWRSSRDSILGSH